MLPETAMWSMTPRSGCDALVISKVVSTSGPLSPRVLRSAIRLIFLPYG